MINRKMRIISKVVTFESIEIMLSGTMEGGFEEDIDAIIRYCIAATQENPTISVIKFYCDKEDTEGFLNSFNFSDLYHFIVRYRYLFKEQLLFYFYIAFLNLDL